MMQMAALQYAGQREFICLPARQPCLLQRQSAVSTHAFALHGFTRGDAKTAAEGSGKIGR